MAGVLILGRAKGVVGAESPGARFAALRDVVEHRLSLVPRLRQRVVRVPLGLQRPAWVDDPHIDLDHHVRRASLPAPGGRRELNALIGDLMGRPLDPDRPLWEMVVVEGLEGDRTAVVARLHHAVLDGVSGATAMAAFLDVGPKIDQGVEATEAPGAEADRERDPRSRSVPGSTDGADRTWQPPPLPSALSMLRYAASSLGRQPETALGAVQRGIDAMMEIAEQNRRLAGAGCTPPPALFSAPRSSLNGHVSGQRRYETVAVALEELAFVRDGLGPSVSGSVVRGGDDPGPPTPEGTVDPGRPGRERRPECVTINDVILSAVGGALARLLERRGEVPSSSLIALVPVSTRGRPDVPAPGEEAEMGNYVSGMLVSLATTALDPVERLCRIALGTKVAKAQEERAGGDLLEGVARALPPLLVSATMRGAAVLGLFDRLPPPFNVVVSTVMVPDVSLRWARHPVEEIYPVGPVAAGVGLNVTAMTYKDTVHFGLLGCRRLVPDLDALALLLGESIGELAAVVGSPFSGASGSDRGRAG